MPTSKFYITKGFFTYILEDEPPQTCLQSKQIALTKMGISKCLNHIPVITHFPADQAGYF